MAVQYCYLLLSLQLLLALGLVGSTTVGNVTFPPKYDPVSFNRHSFPPGFIFGSSASAYQVEGAAKVGGRGPSIWDTYTHQHPERIKDGSNGDVAIDQYHRYKEDVALMKEIGLDAYRFSISWSRVLPKGKLKGGVNMEGIKYYNDLINELLSKGIQPFVTIFHWDVPQALEDEYRGFLSDKIVDDYRDYAEVCFKYFGDRVKHWITFNEPSGFSYSSYGLGTFAPGRCSAWQNLNCLGGDSGTEPYIVTHHQILGHAAAAQVYKTKYQAKQKGMIGITLYTNWMVPYSNSKHNINAAKRSLDFNYGWYMDPLVYGDYPHVMKSFVGDRLPKFSEEQSKMVKGSFDFIGINYYSANFAQHAHLSNTVNASLLTDSRVNLLTERNGIPIGQPRGASDWMYVYPKGLRDLLLYTKINYKNPLVYITENGVDEFNNDTTLPLKKQLSDYVRVDSYYRHLSFLKSAVKDGVNVKGFFAWSFADNFEWATGYTVRFGLNYIDYKNGLKRYPKLSAHWFHKFLKK